MPSRPPGSNLRKAGVTQVIPSITVGPQTSPADTGVAKKQSIATLITDLAKSDPHLWNALTSLQDQANSLVNQNSDWTSWTPTFYGNNGVLPPQNVSLVYSNLSAYYMTVGMILYIELNCQLTLQAGILEIIVTLPLDVGSTGVKCCPIYIANQAVFPVNGVAFVVIQGKVAIFTITPALSAAGPTNSMICDFAMGGAIGIIQGS